MFQTTKQINIPVHIPLTNQWIFIHLPHIAMIPAWASSTATKPEAMLDSA